MLRIVPRDRRQPYNMRKLVAVIVDRDSLFEIQPTFGRAVITSLARMNGKVVGVIANNPMVYGGAMDVKAARKQTHFIELCDCFHIPLVFLVDVPGFMVGTEAEAAATLREGMRAVYVGLQATVPMFTVVIRKCYGMAGMGATDKNGLDFKIAWPSAEWGSLPIEGGVAAAFRREIEAARRSQGARARDRGGAARGRLAVPDRRGVRRRGHHRSARDAALSVPLHRCGAGQPRDQARAQAEVWRAAVSAAMLRSQWARRRCAEKQDGRDADDDRSQSPDRGCARGMRWRRGTARRAPR